MQRRGISADIVKNPSTTERKLPFSTDSSHVSIHGDHLVDLDHDQTSPLQQYLLVSGAPEVKLPLRTSARPLLTGGSSSMVAHMIGDKSYDCRHANISASYACRSPQNGTWLSYAHGAGELLTPPESSSSSCIDGDLLTKTELDVYPQEFLPKAQLNDQVSMGCASVATCTAAQNHSSHDSFNTFSEQHVQSRLPQLKKETAKQYSYVDSLVDVATSITSTLWPCLDAVTPRQKEHSIRMISYFITETSRKSKTSLSTMQLALLYCIRFKRDQNNMTHAITVMTRQTGKSVAELEASVGSSCARRNFLSALILASKYLQDRNFSNKAWSKISSVSVSEINLREREFLEITKWNLDVKHDIFRAWSSTMERFIADVRDHSLFGRNNACGQIWRIFIQKIMYLPDVAMNACLLQASNCMNLPVVDQLLTPIGTPKDEISEFITVSSPTSSADPDSPRSSKLGEVKLPKVQDAIQSCPFFDEYIKSTPCESPIHLCEAEVTSTHAVQTQLDTPDSLRYGSPYSADGRCDDAQANQARSSQVLKQSGIVGTMSMLDHIPATPKPELYSSFSIIPEWRVNGPVGQKRKAVEAGLDLECNDREDVLFTANRKKLMEAF